MTRTSSELARRVMARQRAAIGAAAVLGTVLSAIGAKEMVAGGVRPPALSAVVPDRTPDVVRSAWVPTVDPLAERPSAGVAEPVLEAADERAGARLSLDGVKRYPAGTRWFDGRPVGPVKRMRMTVTAYSPHAASCWPSDDGITASLHRVDVNGFRLVAADSRLLPLGSLVSVPGYDEGRVVPVLDRGGKIKGKRLDVMFATHEEARRWGVRTLEVVVWDYLDGKGRKLKR